MEETKHLLELLSVKKQEGLELLITCDELAKHNVAGTAKLKRKIQIEIDNLEQLTKDPSRLKRQHLTGNNLVHFNALCKTAGRYPDIVAVLAPFRQNDSSNLVVDVVANGGATWVKAIARNARGLHFSWSGETCSKERSIVDQARDYLEASQCNFFHYKQPKVVFEFGAGLTSPIFRELKNLGITVKGDIKSIDLNSSSNDDSDDDDDISDDKECSDNDSDVNSDSENLDCPTVDHVFSNSDTTSSSLSINLDITALFAYVSNLTNGFANFCFKERVLDEQASRERTHPVLPGLKSLLAGRKLICCRTAYDSFLNILKTVGGDQEKQRAAELCSNIVVVDDRMSEKTEKLHLGGKIKPRSKIIFGSGDFYQAVTLTANKSFVHAAASQGYKFAVIIHESRALSEQKQQNAAAL